MKRKDYWKNRFDQVEQAANNQAVDYQQTLERKYRIALRNIEGKISAMNVLLKTIILPYQKHGGF